MNVTNAIRPRDVFDSSYDSARDRSTAPERRERDDIERDDIGRMARTLARQNGAREHEWPRYVETAKSLIRQSRRWTQGC